MDYVRYKVSAPGSLMLLGEHAVLHNHKAIVCAIDQRLTVELIPSNNQKISILSDRLGEHHCQLTELSVIKPFEFLLTAILYYQSLIPCGFTLKITSEFSEKIGLGSSAAVTVATVFALSQWLSQPLDTLTLFKTCLAIIRSVQGMASGADIAASLLGGVVALRPDPLHLEQLSSHPSIALIYSGHKTPTVDVINQVQHAYQKYPNLLTRLFNAIADCTEIGFDAIHQKNWPVLGKVFGLQQNLMAALGVSDATLDKIIKKLNKKPALLGAKISGSGLGDCVVTLTTPAFSPFSLPNDWQAEGIRWIAGKIDPRGVIHECL